jgi:nucleolin
VVHCSPTACGLEGPVRSSRAFRDGQLRPRRSPQDARPESRGPIQNKLFVGNLDFAATQDELMALFAETGEVVSVTLPTDRDSGRPRGFAFVEMSTGEQAAAARGKLDGFALHGRAMRVDTATDRPAAGAGPRASGFDRGPGGGFARGPRPRAKGSRRNLRARRRGF